MAVHWSYPVHTHRQTCGQPAHNYRQTCYQLMLQQTATGLCSIGRLSSDTASRLRWQQMSSVCLWPMMHICQLCAALSRPMQHQSWTLYHVTLHNLMSIMPCTPVHIQITRNTEIHSGNNKKNRRNTQRARTSAHQHWPTCCRLLIQCSPRRERCTGSQCNTSQCPHS